VLEKPSSSTPRAFYRNREKNCRNSKGFFSLLHKFWGTTLFFFVLSKKRKMKGQRKWKVFENIVWPVLRAMVPGGRWGRCTGTADDSRTMVQLSGGQVPQWGTNHLSMHSNPHLTGSCRTGQAEKQSCTFGKPI